VPNLAAGDESSARHQELFFWRFQVPTKSVKYSFFQALSSSGGGNKIRAGGGQAGSFTW
jgi:hypothetical protein